jgi:hypothetical protein
MPAKPLDLELHNLNHVAEQVQLLGPSCVTVSWQSERLRRKLVRGVANKAHQKPACAAAAAAMTWAGLSRALDQHRPVVGLPGCVIEGNRFLQPASWIPTLVVLPGVNATDPHIKTQCVTSRYSVSHQDTVCHIKTQCVTSRHSVSHQDTVCHIKTQKGRAVYTQQQ